jgi:DNA-binding transcriptional regulator YdaS (Cro superfamily)
MDELRKFLNSISTEEQTEFAIRAGTTIGYLRKAIYSRKRKKFDVNLVIGIEKASYRKVRREQLRPDVDWKYLRT